MLWHHPLKEVVMQSQREVKVIVSPAFFGGGMSTGCKHCRTIFGQGYFGVSVVMEGRQHLLAPQEPVVCCGEVKVAYQLFDSEEEAWAVVQKVIESMARNGLTGIRLVEVAVFEPVPGQEAMEH